MVPTRDGRQLPVSIVYRRGFERNGQGRLFLYAYGAYGIATRPASTPTASACSTAATPIAIAHIRGGDEMGYQWYLDGKLERRTNTFNDFVDAARGLIAQDYTSAGRIAIQGGSAGGELMGAVVNSDPELWGAVVADVPFVDVLNTMLDDTLPLTPGEWNEWGNPITDPAAFRLHAKLQPVRQCPRPGLSADADHRRPQRSARHLLGAGQMGGAAARDPDRRPISCCSRSTWAPAMAASRAAGRVSGKWPRPMPSC